MPRIGIIGGGIAGTQLGLFLRQHGIAATIYTEKTAEQHRAARISNVVVRNGLTRARERALGIDDWDGQAPDLVRLNLTVNGPQPIRFSGALDPPSQVVDMRIYWARLLEAFASRGGDLVFGTVSSRDVEQLATQYGLLVVASGRGSLCNMFPRLPEHSPFDAPQRLVVVGICRGVRYPDPLAFDVVVTRGHGEILSFPMFSFEPGLTAFGIEAAHGGAFDRLVGLQRETERAQFEATLLDLLREYAPHLHARIDTSRFQVAGSRNIGHVAITPVVRRGYVCLSNGRLALALGDAHIVMDPITGQGANKASCAAWVLGEAIVGAVTFDEEFCRRVEQQEGPLPPGIHRGGYKVAHRWHEPRHHAGVGCDFVAGDGVERRRMIDQTIFRQPRRSISASNRNAVLTAVVVSSNTPNASCTRPRSINNSTRLSFRRIATHSIMVGWVGCTSCHSSVT